MELDLELDLQECPICRGAALLEDENDWCCYVACMDCGAHTAHMAYLSSEDRPEAVQRAVRLWNIGKVLTDTPNE